ncbi:MAG: virulence protein RhuM/Fic/DOC family protein [Peptostreptococcaceae bacterium]|nr:virulence protein RhuM/Fic/DOC family protein [Peptostreptococcaceae bacterium]
MSDQNELVLFRTVDEQIKLDVSVDGETVWLNRLQMAELFERDVKTIGKHINNAIREELNDSSVVAKFATTAADGKTYQVEHYNLDAIISVGYRVKSNRGLEFRRWANTVLKEHILNGYSINTNRIKQLGKVIKILKRAENSLDAKQVLSVIESYSVALNLLDDYDHQRIGKPQGSEATYILTYDECKQVITQMRFGAESDLFGNEKDESFNASIGAIYQTFDGKDVYRSTQEKAANLLYFVTKNHSFTDGNKRIAAMLFLYFLDKNDILFTEDGKIIEDNTLVAITIMIAESKPEEKEAMVNLVMNFLE